MEKVGQMRGTRNGAETPHGANTPNGAETYNPNETPNPAEALLAPSRLNAIRGRLNGASAPNDAEAFDLIWSFGFSAPSDFSKSGDPLHLCNVSTYVYMYMYMYMYTYIYIYICIHTYICTCTYM